MELTITNTVATMTSNKIAEITGKDHKHVIRDIETALKSLGPDLGANFIEETEYKSKRGMKRNYTLSKNAVILMLSGYSIPHRLALINKLDEYETQLKEDGFIMSDSINNKQIEQAKEVFNAKKQLNLFLDEDITIKKLKEQVTPHFKEMKFDLRMKEIKRFEKLLSNAKITDVTILAQARGYAIELKDMRLKAINHSKKSIETKRNNTIEQLKEQLKPVEPDYTVTVKAAHFSKNYIHEFYNNKPVLSYTYKKYIKNFPTKSFLTQAPNLPNDKTQIKFKIGGCMSAKFDQNNTIEPMADQLQRMYGINDKYFIFDGFLEDTTFTYKREEEFMIIEFYI